MRCRFLIAGLIVWASAVAPLQARAETGLWAVATDTCSPDGHKCIRGIMKDGAPFTSRAACEQRAHALLRQYTAAHLKVSYIRCVQL